MPRADAQAVVGDADIGHNRIAQRACAVRDTKAVGRAVCDVQVVEVDSRDAPVFQKQLQSCPPPDPWIEAAATIQIAPLDNGGSAVVGGVVESGAQKNAAAVSHVLEQAILNPIAFTSINRTSIGQKG